jgi:hypothetical protein
MGIAMNRAGIPTNSPHGHWINQYSGRDNDLAGKLLDITEGVADFPLCVGQAIRFMWETLEPPESTEAERIYDFSTIWACLDLAASLNQKINIFLNWKSFQETQHACPIWMQNDGWEYETVFPGSGLSGWGAKMEKAEVAQFYVDLVEALAAAKHPTTGATVEGHPAFGGTTFQETAIGKDYTDPLPQEDSLQYIENLKYVMDKQCKAFPRHYCVQFLNAIFGTPVGTTKIPEIVDDIYTTNNNINYVMAGPDVLPNKKSLADDNRIYGYYRQYTDSPVVKANSMQFNSYRYDAYKESDGTNEGWYPPGKSYGDDQWWDMDEMMYYGIEEHEYDLIFWNIVIFSPTVGYSFDPEGYAGVTALPRWLSPKSCLNFADQKDYLSNRVTPINIGTPVKAKYTEVVSDEEDDKTWFFITETAVNDTHGLSVRYENENFYDNQIYAFDLHIRPDFRTKFLMRIRKKDGTLFDCDFDVTVFESETVGAGGKVQYLMNNFYKFRVTLDVGEGEVDPMMTILAKDAGGNLTYAGDDTQASFSLSRNRPFKAIR